MKKFFLSVALALCCVGLSAQRVSVGTNAVEWANLGTINAEVGIGVSQHLSIHAGARYNNWLFRKGNPDDRIVDPSGDTERQFQNKKQAYNLTLRWWPWHIYSGWWIGARGQWMEYNRGGILSRSTEEGKAVGAGLSAGYTRMLHRNWNIEFGIGVWGGTTRYTTYACPTCGTVTDNGKKVFVLPDDVMVSLIYIF